MAKTFAAQVNQLPNDPPLRAALEFLCTASNNLYNCTVYLARQLYFKAGKFSNGQWLSSQMKHNAHMKALYTSAAQQTCISVGEAFNGYRELLKLWRSGGLAEKPKPPNYRRSGGMFELSYPQRWLKLVNGQVRVPMGRACKVWFDLPEIFLPFPSNLDWAKVRELQIVPRAGYFDAVWICTGKPVEPVALDTEKSLAIDHGIDNWLTCVDSEGHSFIVDGKHLKALNQGYNKRVATIKEGKAQAFWCKLLDKLTGKRNRQMRDAVNKAARLVINHCLKHGMGTIVFGWNQGQKSGANMGHKANQKFVQIPTAKLKSRIAQLCEAHGILFIEQEESYTSQASALDLDAIPVYGEKPEGWKASGQRIRRGTYRCGAGVEVNADANGAWNIGRKAKVTGMQCTPARGVLTSPKRLRIWDLPDGSILAQKCCNPSGESPSRDSRGVVKISWNDSCCCTSAPRKRYMTDDNQLPTRDTATYEGQIPPSLERVIPAMRRFGQISFWFQLVLGVIAGLIFFFAGFVGSNTGEANTLSPEEGPGLFFAITGLVALAIGMYWALRYTQIAKRLAIPDASLRPTRSQTVGSLQTGVLINLVGMLFNLIAAQIITGLLMVKVLSSEGVQFSPAALSRLVQPIDIFVVLANTNSLFAHFVALSCSLWLLRLVHTLKSS